MQAAQVETEGQMAPANTSVDDEVRERFFGRCVILCGLMSRPELNGVVATVGEWYEVKRRFAVHSIQIDGPLLLKPSNLSLASEEQEAADRDDTQQALADRVRHLKEHHLACPVDAKESELSNAVDNVYYVRVIAPSHTIFTSCPGVHYSCPLIDLAYPCKTLGHIAHI